MTSHCFSVVQLASSLPMILLLFSSLGCKSREYIAREPAVHEMLREMRVPAIDMREAHLQDVVEYLNAALNEYGLGEARKETIIVFECPAHLSRRKLNPVPIAKDKSIDTGMTKIVSVMDIADEVCSRANVNLVIKSNRAIFTGKR